MALVTKLNGELNIGTIVLCMDARKQWRHWPDKCSKDGMW